MRGDGGGARPRLRPALDGLPDYVAGRPPAGTFQGRAYKISSNENPYPPLPSVVDVVAGAARQLNRYPDMAAADLVAAVAARCGVPADWISVGPGSAGVLAQVLQATSGDGDEVVHAWRSFEAYPIFTSLSGAAAVTVPLSADGRHDLPAMAEAVTDRTRLLLVCSPNNPTGPAVTTAELEELLADVPRDVVVVLDEAYAEFVRDPQAPDGVAMVREHPNLVVLRTFSKAYGLAGLRVGYGIARPPVAAALRKAALPFGVSGIAQAAAVASLAPPAERELLERVDALVAERERVVAALAGQGWTLPQTQANFVWLPLGEATAAFADACSAAGISVRAFDGDGARCTIAEPEANDRLLAVCAAWPARCGAPA